jgi:RHS repeat-associated protein
VSTAVLEAPERPSSRLRPTCRHRPGHHPSRHPRSYCRGRKGLAQPKTRVRAIVYACSARVALLRPVPPAHRPENSTRYAQLGVAFTFGFEGKNGIGTDTDAGGIVLMGARLYDPGTGRFLQVDPVFGGSCNAYDYTCQDPVNACDLNGLDYVYILYNVKTGVPYYVGRSVNPLTRLNAHERSGRFNKGTDAIEQLDTGNLSRYEARVLEQYTMEKEGTMQGSGSFPNNQRNEMSRQDMETLSDILCDNPEATAQIDTRSDIALQNASPEQRAEIYEDYEDDDGV